MDKQNDNKVKLIISTVDGHLSAMIACSVCDKIFADTDFNSEVGVSKMVGCDHKNEVSVWEYLGRPT